MYENEKHHQGIATCNKCTQFIIMSKLDYLASSVIDFTLSLHFQTNEKEINILMV